MGRSLPSNKRPYCSCREWPCAQARGIIQSAHCYQLATNLLRKATSEFDGQRLLAP